MLHILFIHMRYLLNILFKILTNLFVIKFLDINTQNNIYVFILSYFQIHYSDLFMGVKGD